ncbi:hypothetical protein B0T14DRAFT_534139 [Immersiella caudata]|uniref:NodB homology domain-containing protein n=1 Tax=Immersiella caudata TaxID=314043 RepID=A0AA40C691_9PEZI|nr:hypothetical protein B0T14DRAFT_534139 [Immersiella caudata]
MSLSLHCPLDTRTHNAQAPESSRHHNRDVKLMKRQQCGLDSEHFGTGCQPQFGSCTTEEGNDEDPDVGNPGGGGILDVPRPKLGKVPYGVQINTCTAPRTIAITFDDGPYLYTSKLLSLLKQHDAKVTFFINGHNWANAALAPYPNILRQMIADGHQIGSHTDNHLDLNAIDSATRKQQMAGCNVACQTDMAALGYHVIMWNIDTLDYDNNTPAKIQNSVDIFSAAMSPNATSKYITLEHDVHETTVSVLAEQTIKTALARGYKLVTAGECLGDPAGNWYRNATTGEAISGDGGSGNPGGGNPGGGGSTEPTEPTEPTKPIEPELPLTPGGQCGSNKGGYTCLGS